MRDLKFRPVSRVEEASRLMKDGPPSQAMLMAGGTDLLVLKQHRLVLPSPIVYLKTIPGLAEIRSTRDGGMAVGALATLDDVARHPMIKQAYPMLAKAAFSVASPQVRHKATIGGNICLNTRCWFYNRSPFWRASYPDCRKASAGDNCYVVPESRKGCFALQSGDTVGPLAALGAQLRLVSDEGDRVVPVEDFYLNDGVQNLALEPGEIVTEVLLPQATEAGAFFKFRPQNNLDFATFTLSVLPSGNGRGARIVVGSVATRPLRAREAEKMLDQGTWEASDVSRKAASELKLVSFVRGSVDFKKQVIEAYLTRILDRLKGKASEMS